MAKRYTGTFELNRSSPALATLDLRGVIGLPEEGGIDPQSVADSLRGVDAPALRVTINSPGGSVDAGIDIYNALRGVSERGTRVETYNSALSASIASVILMAGDRRIGAPHSRVMVHEAMALGFGFAGDFEKLALRLRDTTANIASIYAERTGTETAEWLPLMADETWFSDEQALERGLVTEIGRGYDPENFATASRFDLLNHYRSRPEFDPEVVSSGRALGISHRGRLLALRDEIDALIGEIGPEKAEIEAQKAPEGDPEPSLTPREQAKADLERRLALIRL